MEETCWKATKMIASNLDFRKGNKKENIDDVESSRS
jgi:hypothetical protein